MKLKRRILAIFIVLIMLMPNFLTPFQNIAFATGERSVELVLANNDMTVNVDGSIDTEVYREVNEGTIHVEVYNDHGEKFNLVDCTNDPDHKKASFGNKKQAYCTISFDDIKNCYLKITSNDIPDLNNVHFFIGTDDIVIDEQNRFFLNEDVLDQYFDGIAFNSIRDLGAPKRVEFSGENVTISGNTVTMDNPLMYSTGTMSFTVYNANGTATVPEMYSNAPKAFTRLNTNTFKDAYMIVEASDGDLENLSFNFFGETLEVNPTTGRVDLRDLEHTDNLIIDKWRVSKGYKEISVTASHTSISDNRVTFDSPIEDNPGRITMAFYNSDGTTPVIIEPYTDWNEEPLDTGCTIFLNSTNYEGVYATITGDGTFNLNDIKLQFDGNNYLIQEVGQEKRFYFPTELEPDPNHPNIPRNIVLDQWTVKPLYEKIELWVNGNNLVVNNNTATMDSPIEDLPGTLTFAFYNSDNTPATVKLDEWWEGDTHVVSSTNATVRFNTTEYEGTYMVVTSTSNPAVDLNEIKFQFGDGEDTFINNQGKVYFPTFEDEHQRVNLNAWSIQALHPKKEINAYGNHLTISGNAITMDCDIPGNEGTLTFAFFNADKTPATVYIPTFYNFETDQEEPEENSAKVKFSSTTYEGTYFTVASNSNPKVDLDDVRFNFVGEDFRIDENNKVTLTADLDDVWVNLDEYSIKEINTRKEVYIENIYANWDKETFTATNINNDGTVTIDCKLENNQGKLKIGAYNKDGTMVPLELEPGWTDDPDEAPPINARGKLKTSTFEGAYFTVESISNPGVDLSKIEFAFAGLGQEVEVVNGKVYIPNLERTHAVINEDNIRNKAKNNVTIKATATNGFLSDIAVNNIEYIEYREPGQGYEHISSVTKTLNIEARTNDSIRVGVEYGYVINTLKINGQTVVTDGDKMAYLGEFPHADTYNIEVTCAKNERILPFLRWSRTDDPYGDHCIVQNGMIEVISVTLPDGTTYDADEIVEINDPGMGMHYRHDGEATLWQEYDQDGNVIAGEIGAKKGSVVTVRLTPDSGFQVANPLISNNGVAVTLTPTEEAGEFKFTMPVDIDPIEEDVLFAGVFTPAQNDAISELTTFATSATIDAGTNVVDSGTIRLSVINPASATFSKVGFADALAPKYDNDKKVGYDIKAYFVLGQAWYKATPDTEWFVDGSLATSSIPVTVTLANALDVDDMVIIGHSIDSTLYSEISYNYDDNTKTITFTAPQFGEYAFATKKLGDNIYPDVPTGKWYTKGIQFVKNYGIMTGYTSGKNSGKFGLNDPIKRGQIVTMLYRLAGEPDTTGIENPFSDVPDGKYYTEAVKWAVKNGITTGKKKIKDDNGNVIDQKFLPDDYVTRQEIATFMSRVAEKYYGEVVKNVEYDLSKFRDGNDISEFAIEPLKYICKKGIITGKEHKNSAGEVEYLTINAKSNATRAEAATMFERFIEIIVEASV